MADRQTESALSESIRKEQDYVSMLYGLLDAARARSEESLREGHGRGSDGGTFAARMDREVSAYEQARRLSQLNSVDRGLCFGRMDDTGRHTFYIGRIGLHDDEYEPVLIDWRAPAARPFYAATPNDPVGLLRRRHLYTRGRTVVGLDDEVFDLDRMSEADRRGLVGEAMLLATVQRGRTRGVSDVGAHLQAEQDRVIRSSLSGVLVVQGGPGTGKTVAALHRAAFLLYTHRRTLERRGVLIIGPNATFLRYISQVLPSLGETDVVLSSLGELFPGVRAVAEEDPATAVIKSDLRSATGSPPPATTWSWRSTGCRSPCRPMSASGPASGPAACAGRTTSPASCSSPRCWTRSPGPRRSRSAAAWTPRTCPTCGPGCGTRTRSGPRWTGCGRSSPPSGCWPRCWRRKVPSAGPLLPLLSKSY